jgi:hypothetical protein
LKGHAIHRGTIISRMADLSETMQARRQCKCNFKVLKKKKKKDQPEILYSVNTFFKNKSEINIFKQTRAERTHHQQLKDRRFFTLKRHDIPD